MAVEEQRKIIIQTKGLCKAFGKGEEQVWALRDIDLEVRQGEILGVIGLSGAGKSTLVRCLNLLERPTAGQVFFVGRELSALSKKELLKSRQSIGMIFQQFNLLMQRNALKNVCFPLELAGVPKAQAEARARELLEIVGLAERAEAYPSQLSGGQKQRVAIARALATNPQVLLCDEATSALDPTTTRSILELLKRINQELGITIVVITHEMSVIEEICHRVAIIDQSRVAEVGPVTEVFIQPKSQIARQLVFPEERHERHFTGRRLCRIVFDGRSSFEPVIANMVLECRAPINIMFADTRDIDGKAIGQMVVQLPEEELIAARMLRYLSEQGITYEEVKENA